MPSKPQPSKTSRQRRPAPCGLSAALILVFAVACTGLPSPGARDQHVVAHTPVPGDVEPWTSLAIDDDTNDFDFVVVTDRTGGHREHVFRDAMPKLNLLRPAFVMSVGDLIEGYTEDRDELKAQWDEFEGFIDQLGMPFFYLGGNHDISNDVMAEVWRERFGASYYHFRYKDVLFLALNSELFGMVSNPGKPVGGPDKPSEQMAYIEKVLSENRDARWTLVFVHQPFWDYEQIHPDWLKVENLLGKRPYTVFAGHLHEYTLHRRNDRKFITLATTGGGSPLRGVVYGEFDHVMQVSMREEGPVFANLLLDGVHGVDVRDEDLRETLRKLEKTVRATSSRFEGGLFTGGPLTFKLHNDGDAPVRFAGRFRSNGDLALAPHSQDELRGELPPNSVVPITLDVLATRATPFEDLAPGKIDWTLSTTSAAGQAMKVRTHSSVAPERLFTCQRSSALKVDGNLEDWGALRFDGRHPAVIERPKNVGRSGDISFRFDVRCSDEFVYIGVDVEDDSIVATPDRVGREQDGVRILIDSRPDPKRSANGDSFFAAILDGTFAQTVSLTAGPEPNPARDSVFEKFIPPPPDGLISTSNQTAGGYSTEFAIPIEVLNALHGEEFEALRVELSVADFDEGDIGHSTLWWKPSRFSGAAIPGSGTFARP